MTRLERATACLICAARDGCSGDGIMKAGASLRLIVELIVAPLAALAPLPRCTLVFHLEGFAQMNPKPLPL